MFDKIQCEIKIVYRMIRSYERRLYSDTRMITDEKEESKLKNQVTKELEKEQKKLEELKKKYPEYFV